MDEKTAPTLGPLKSFASTLGAVRYGQLDEELGREVRALMTACNQTGKAGALTIKLSFKPGKAGQIEISDDYTSKVPKFERGTTLGFVSDTGDFTREDPRQAALPGVRSLNDIDTGTGEVKTPPASNVANLKVAGASR